jgi:homoserine O-acetyltransferase
MNQGIRIHHHPHPFTTESGHTFPELEIAYKTWGTLNESADNAVLICHALTGHAAADEWFPGLFDADGILDPSRQFIVCSNVLGSCYGTTGPRTGRARGGDFPVVTIRDMVRVEQILLDALGVRSIELAIGGSMGGMQVLEWSVMDTRVQKMMIIAMGKAHSAWAIAISEAQRQAIYADPVAGLSAARQMGMVL